MYVSNWRRIFTLFLAACLLSIPLLAADKEPAAEDIDRLIRQLGSDKFSDREAASKRLTDIGEPALDQLRKAADATDVEVRRRVRDLLKVIELPPFVVRTDSPLLGMALAPDGTRLITIGTDLTLRGGTRTPANKCYS